MERVVTEALTDCVADERSDVTGVDVITFTLDEQPEIKQKRASKNVMNFFNTGPFIRKRSPIGIT